MVNIRQIYRRDKLRVLFRHIVVSDNAADREECATCVFFRVPLCSTFPNHLQDEP